MADGSKTSGPMFGKKTVLPPIGRSSDGSGDNSPTCSATSEQAQGDKPKIKTRPPKLKTPLDLVISTDVALGASQHRPIGTPPPTSLRKPRHNDISSFSADPLGSFPKINVENCLEGHDDDSDNNGSAFPALNPHPMKVACRANEMDDQDPKAPDNQRKRLNSENNNQGVYPCDMTSPLSPSASSLTSLIPPQRLVTRDQDGVVFELTSQELQGTPKTSAITPSKKPTRLEPIVK